MRLDILFSLLQEFHSFNAVKRQVAIRASFILQEVLLHAQRQGPILMAFPSHESPLKTDTVQGPSKPVQNVAHATAAVEGNRTSPACAHETFLRPSQELIATPHLSQLAGKCIARVQIFSN